MPSSATRPRKAHAPSSPTSGTRSAAARKGRRPKAALPEPITDPVESARAAGLRYVTDSKPGIHRTPFRKNFRYTMPDGTSVRDKDTLSRIKSLVIPPAWTDVWISTATNGHLQATGRDARGRKQSRYHPRWREVRDETKYERMSLFAAALPAIRERVDHDLALPGLPREKVLATIVSLMEHTLIRVGNQEYAKENKSYGLTTMRNKHVEVEGSKITFSFQGKSRIHHTINLQDRRLARIIQRCADLPGYELFQYVDREEQPRTVDSSDVNDYLREISGQDFTAKDFRTWAGSVLACAMLSEFEAFNSQTEAKRNVVQAVKAVAERLGNTPSVCRKCYVHPSVIETYLGGSAVAAVRAEVEEEIVDHGHALRPDEKSLLDLLQQRVEAKAKAG